MSGLVIAGSISFLIVTSMLISLSIGFGIDKLFHTFPLFLSIGAIVGFVGSIINIMQLVKTMK